LTEPTPELISALYQALAGIFTIGEVVPSREQAGVIQLYGHFTADTAAAYPIVRQRFATLGYTPLFREAEGRTCIVALPGQLPTERPNVLLAAVLLGVTVLSALIVHLEWIEGRPWWQNLLSGVPFALALMAILLAHELGHYVVARRLGVAVTLPYFIPMPLSLFGTMGAFIRMKSPPQNRRHLLAVGIAGPLAGLALALPLLAVGLSLSEVRPTADACREIRESFTPGPLTGEQPYSILEGNSLLYAAFKAAFYGRFLPDCTPGQARSLSTIVRTALRGCDSACVGEDVFVHPIAFAAWAGLLVTGLNLIPAGTLDGGHVAYALLGKRARYLTNAMILGLALLGLIWAGWFLWAGLVFLLGRRPAVPLDDITPLKRWQVVVGIVVLVIFLLTFTPNPMQTYAIQMAEALR